MKTKILTLACLILWSACNDDSKDLKGHWHFKQNAGTPVQIFSTLDFLDDGRIVFDIELLGQSGAQGNWDGENKTIVLPYSRDEILHFSEKEPGLLSIYQKDGSEILAERCGQGCCDRQRDFFTMSPVNVDLPIILDTTALVQFNGTDRFLVNDVKLGLANAKGYGHDQVPRLVLSDRFASIDDIKIWHEQVKLTHPEPLRKRIKVVIYANHENDLGMLREVILELQKIDEQQIFLALREKDYSDGLKMWLRKIKPQEDLEKIIQQHYKSGDFIKIETPRSN